ncbi:hypothetical protein LY474_29675 [Myxococcus stipitatus]|uniref:hypothetical protein n=1 Tax=Myxococcus stipitatus TaxID=83455 RepID=UPI001F291118|nr:hypothetical protein [Myxococcus stipitatus]MCE9671983.1 hypothetical protein [Myxococcus stipitatus]
MTKRTRIIEGTWNCTSCDTRDILARHKRCPTCNNPRELTGQESEFDFGDVDAESGRSLREGVTDEKVLEIAAAGEDWFCAYCGAANRGDTPKCKHCGGERTPDAKKATLQDLERDEARLPPEVPVKPPPPKRRLATAVVVAVFFGIIAFAVWATRTRELEGEVTGTSWERAVVQERFAPVTKTGWEDELRVVNTRMPVNGGGEVAGVGNVRDCVSRQRGTRKVADGTERVCRTKSRRVACGTEEKCRRRDRGNGFAEETCESVTKYCSESYEDCQNETRYRNEPVYARQCSYDTYEWKPVDRREARGQDDAPRWPELVVGPQDRQRREEKYAVRIHYQRKGDQEHVHQPTNERDFLSWRKGQGVRLTVTNMGTVKKVAPR